MTFSDELEANIQLSGRLNSEAEEVDRIFEFRASRPWQCVGVGAAVIMATIADRMRIEHVVYPVSLFDNRERKKCTRSLMRVLSRIQGCGSTSDIVQSD